MKTDGKKVVLYMMIINGNLYRIQCIYVFLLFCHYSRHEMASGDKGGIVSPDSPTIHQGSAPRSPTLSSPATSPPTKRPTIITMATTENNNGAVPMVTPAGPEVTVQSPIKDADDLQLLKKLEEANRYVAKMN